MPGIEIYPEGTIWGYDISSAYPYQCAFLPCLEHGKWVLTKKRSDVTALSTKAALVHYSLVAHPSADHWGPFPFRDEEGAIIFPRASGGGWVWRDEYLQGERLFGGVGFREAWILTGQRCKCRPFKDVPYYYKQRLRLGKEGPGIVTKLGLNSVYGKLAQSVGKPPFQSWVWAGMITSGCRAQVLELIGLHKDRSNVLAIATDGLYTRERIQPTPKPRDTRTGGPKVLNDKGVPANKPLGGWEEKSWPKGVFFARPGIYFPLDPTDDELSYVRARGVGRASMLESWRLLVEGYHARKKTVHLKNLVRFNGGKSSISVSKARDGEPVYKRALRYGQWTERPVELSFDPLPKREKIVRLRGKPYGLLTLRTMKGESAPYDRARLSFDAKVLKEAEAEALEQPDGGDILDVYEDYEG
jgi:hypothetical protein